MQSTSPRWQTSHLLTGQLWVAKAFFGLRGRYTVPALGMFMVQKRLSVNDSREYEKCSIMACGEWRRTGGIGQESIIIVLRSTHQALTQGGGGVNEGDSWKTVYDHECWPFRWGGKEVSRKLHGDCIGDFLGFIIPNNWAQSGFGTCWVEVFHLSIRMQTDIQF